jgi:CO/xanthine dehydrogenase Mo-binding subunit
MLQRVFTWGAIDAAFAAADRVVGEKYRWHRLGAKPLETFGCMSHWNPVEQGLTRYGSFQSQ